MAISSADICSSAIVAARCRRRSASGSRHRRAGRRRAWPGSGRRSSGIGRPAARPVARGRRPTAAGWPSSAGPAAVSTSSPGPPASQQQLTAPAAGQQRGAVRRPPRSPRRAGPPPPARVQRGHQPAFGAEGEPVGGVLHVAAGHDPAVGGLARPPRPAAGSTARKRVGGRGGRRAQPGPVDRLAPACRHLPEGTVSRPPNSAVSRNCGCGLPGTALVSIWQRHGLAQCLVLPPADVHQV